MSLSKRAAFFVLSALWMSLTPTNTAHAQSTASPRIFYSDLESGPNTGGQGGFGAFVTIYGKGFGATQGSSVVTIGGVAAQKYLIWSDRQPHSTSRISTRNRDHRVRLGPNLRREGAKWGLWLLGFGRIDPPGRGRSRPCGGYLKLAPGEQ